MSNRFILFALLIGNICCFAQKIELPFELSKDKGSLFFKLPIQNQKDSLLFFFDTGASTMLLNTKRAIELGLQTDATEAVAGAGGKKNYAMIQNYTLYLDANHFIDSIPVIIEDLTRLHEYSEKKFDGIIGLTMLRKHVTKLDFNTQTISLYPFGTPLNYEGYEKVPLDLYRSSLLQLPLTITLNTNESFTGTALFDSGAMLSFLMNTPYKEEMEIVKKINQTTPHTSDNLSNHTQYEKGFIRSIQVGNFTFADRHLTLLLSSDEEGVSADPSIMGILGSEIIHRFDFIIDYSIKYLYLKPNYMFDAPFGTNL